MPTNAASYADGKKVKGPAGTASQRAQNAGKTMGRETDSSKKAKKGTKLPDSQGNY